MESEIIKPVLPLETPNPRFHPSPTKKVDFGNGKVIPMNRKERRRQHLYGDRVTKVSGR